MKYLNRHQVREYIARGIKYGLTTRQIVDSIRVIDRREYEIHTGRYGWD